MRSLRIILPWVGLVFGFSFFCWGLYIAGGIRTIWIAANCVSSIDHILSSIVVVPPVVSWMIMGFLIGAVVYFVLHGAEQTARLHQIRPALLAILVAILVGATVAAPQVEFVRAGKMFLRIPMKQPYPGQAENFQGIDFVWVPPGRFRMGSLSNEPGHMGDEQGHIVTLTSGFWMSKNEITQKEWQDLMGSNPPAPESPIQPTLPVHSITWEECDQFISVLNNLAPTPAFRLPTEAEWEYACRAGAPTAYTFGEDPAQLNDYGWYADNSAGQLHDVGQKQPNLWGLYDMHGNVWEWCLDFYGEYPESRVIDPVRIFPVRDSDRHVLRGGGWQSSLQECRSARRYVYLEGYFRRQDDIGFRVVREFRTGDVN